MPAPRKQGEFRDRTEFVLEKKEVLSVASDERDRDEMRVSEPLAELAPRRSTQTSSSA